MHVMNYAHWKDSVVYHGSITDMDGVPRATWSYEKKGKKVTHDQPIDVETFHLLWNGFVKLDVFKRHRVRDPEEIIDLVGHHVIGIIFGDGDEIRQQVSMVPADERDAEFKRWLKALNIPAGSNSPGPRPSFRASVGDYVRQMRSSVMPHKLGGMSAVRQKIYPSYFGPKFKVVRDASGEKPAIDVVIFEPGTSKRGTERDYYCLVTSGMSDKPMRIPDGATFARAELLLYVEKPTDIHINVLQWLARLPHQQKTTWYGPGTTMTNGNPPQPIFDDSELDCYLFLSSIVGEDDVVHRELILDGDPTTLLWVVPIANRECQYIIKSGLDDFLEILDKANFSFVLNEKRRSCIKGKK